MRLRKAPRGLPETRSWRELVPPLILDMNSLVTNTQYPESFRVLAIKSATVSMPCPAAPTSTIETSSVKMIRHPNMDETGTVP